MAHHSIILLVISHLEEGNSFVIELTSPWSILRGQFSHIWSYYINSSVLSIPFSVKPQHLSPAHKALPHLAQAPHPPALLHSNLPSGHTRLCIGPQSVMHAHVLCLCLEHSSFLATHFFYYFILKTLLSAGEDNDNSVQYSCLENPMDGGAL